MGPAKGIASPQRAETVPGVEPPLGQDHSAIAHQAGKGAGGVVAGDRAALRGMQAG